MVEEHQHTTSPVSQIVTKEGTGDMTESTTAHQIPDVLAADGNMSSAERLRFAVLDTGATETVGSMDALETVLSLRHEQFGDEDVHIDASITKSFKFGNGQTRSAASFACLPQVVGSHKTTLGIYALDVPDIPILLGIKTLRKLGAVIDVENQTLEFRHVFPGLAVGLTQGQNGHLWLDLCSDWCPKAPSILATLSPAETPQSDCEQLDRTEENNRCQTEVSERVMTCDEHCNRNADQAVPCSSSSDRDAKVQATESVTTKVDTEATSFYDLGHVVFQGSSRVQASGKAEGLAEDREEGSVGDDLGLQSCSGTRPTRSQVRRPSVLNQPGKGSLTGSNKWAKWETCHVWQDLSLKTPRMWWPRRKRM